MLDINENTRLLFLKAVNDLDLQLKAYAKKPGANPDYIKHRNETIQDIFNFYNEVETVLQNRKFNIDGKNIFVIQGSAGSNELARLRAENRRLRDKLGGPWHKKHFYNGINDREAFRAFHNSRQRDLYGY